MTKDQKVLVLGLGVSGYAAAELAAANGAEVTVIDAADTPWLREKAERLSRQGIAVELGCNAETWTESVDLAVISPGIPFESSLGKLAASLSCPVLSELDYGFRKCCCPVIAVTGTNGKTTTVEMLTHCLAGSGYKVQAGGNIGTPLCALAAVSASLDFIVAEVSSFQLRYVRGFAPAAAVFLNFSPDHLNWHGDTEEYLFCKCRIFEHLRKPEQAVLRLDLLDLPQVRRALPESGRGCRTFSLGEHPDADFCRDTQGNLVQRVSGQDKILMPVSALSVQGGHNQENALAVFAAAAAVGIAPESLVPAIKSFSTGPHRLEDLGEIRGVRYINDSKSTNPDSLCRALEAVADPDGRKIILIAGGVDKNLDFKTALPLIKNTVKEVFLIGTCRKRLAKQWECVVCCKIVESFADAIRSAATCATAGDTVLLSPGCASFDMFKDYTERGDYFREFVKRELAL